MTDAIAARDIHSLLDEAPMSRVQITAVGIIAALSMLDGYDVLSVSFAAPAIAHAWHIGKTDLGIVLSSGLVGMAFGSLLLAPLADIWGRRQAVFGALTLMILGGVLSALSQSVLPMALSRVVTGLGIGVLVAVITPLAAEFANLKRRAFAVAIMAVGYPFGGVIGGLAAAFLLQKFGWPSVFVVKSIVALILLPVALFGLPESPAFLMGRNHPRATQRLSDYMTRCGHAPVHAIAPETSAPARGYTALFVPGQASTTFRLMAVNGLYAMSAFYVLSWLPQMVVDAGYHASTASVVSAIANLSGVVGGLLLGFAARWIKLRGLVIGAVTGLGVAMAAFGFAPTYLPLLTLAAGVCGFFLIAGVSGVYATIATAFQPQVRASGAGLVMGFGRVTSATAPYLAGWMFANGFGRDVVSVTFAGLALLAAVALAIPLGKPAAR